jgi:hypothetical protein
MKLAILFVLAFSAIAAAPSRAADTPTVEGKWSVHVSFSGNDSDTDCTFAVKDNAITGKCISNGGTAEVTGRVDGNKVTWTYQVPYNGSPLTVVYNGTLSPTGIGGTAVVTEFGATGDFTAVRPQ